tara:strand:+ start:1328 stop:1795 length:468 start_codon:yes stop_codon:yes gene_type:complete
MVPWLKPKRKNKMVKYVKSHGGREKYFSTKYKKDIAGDCVIRAISHGTGFDYMEVFTDLCNLAITTGYLPNDKKTYGQYLSSLGWTKHSPMKNGHKKKVRLKSYKTEGTYIVLTARHLTCIKDGVLYDSWDCRRWCGNSYWIKEPEEIRGTRFIK